MTEDSGNDTKKSLLHDMDGYYDSMKDKTRSYRSINVNPDDTSEHGDDTNLSGVGLHLMTLW